MQNLVVFLQKISEEAVKQYLLVVCRCSTLRSCSRSRTSAERCTTARTSSGKIKKRERGMAKGGSCRANRNLVHMLEASAIDQLSGQKTYFNKQISEVYPGSVKRSDNSRAVPAHGTTVLISTVHVLKY